MTARRFVLLVEGLLMEQYGRDAVLEWHASALRDEVAERRRQNVLAAIELGADLEIG